tara:strand:- start:190 stop:399 length:210 start_codon:yes stop_codon:yes gene_type:complete
MARPWLFRALSDFCWRNTSILTRNKSRGGDGDDDDDEGAGERSGGSGDQRAALGSCDEFIQKGNKSMIL